MRAEDIKVGMWLRDPGGDVCKTSRQSEWVRWVDEPKPRQVIVRGWHVEYPDGRLHTWPSEQLEPWTPRVGEWVRLDMVDTVDGRGHRGKVGRVREVKYGIAFIEDSVAGQLSPRAGCYHVEPCLPPAPPTTHLRADGVEVPATISEADGCDYLDMADAADRYYRAHVAGANSTCLHCGGLAYLGLQEARCLAPKCERAEPEPDSVYDFGIRGELVWRAKGRGKMADHPIREEAIRLWREAVSRG